MGLIRGEVVVVWFLREEWIDFRYGQNIVSRGGIGNNVEGSGGGWIEAWGLWP